MGDLGMILTLLGILGILVFGVMGIIAGIMKSGKVKTNMIRMGISFGVAVIGFITFGVSLPDSEEASTEVSAQEEKVKEADTQKKEVKETPEEKAEREAKEKAEAEAKEKDAADKKAKEEAEAKKKAEEEAKAKEEAKKKAQEELAAKKANAQTIEYARLKKNPDRYKDEYVKYTGEVVQIMEGDDVTNIRLAVTKDDWGYDFNDVIFIEYAGLTDYIEEDVITVYGTIYGEYSYTSQAGWEISIPGMIADSFE